MKRLLIFLIMVNLMFVLTGCNESSKKTYEKLVAESQGFKKFADQFKHFDGSLLMSLLYLENFSEEDKNEFQEEAKDLIHYDYPVCIYNHIVDKYGKNKLKKLFNDEEAMKNYNVAKEKYDISLNKLTLDTFIASYSCSAEIVNKLEDKYEKIFDE
ncbi:MAG: hypothetical protein SVN78_05120 [Deferribacterota bacterium]|nr:hypothetical protein [Deferribacterota bacterium]